MSWPPKSHMCNRAASAPSAVRKGADVTRTPWVEFQCGPKASPAAARRPGGPPQGGGRPLDAMGGIPMRVEGFAADPAAELRFARASVAQDQQLDIRQWCRAGGPAADMGTPRP